MISVPLPPTTVEIIVYRCNHCNDVRQRDPRFGPPLCKCGRMMRAILYRADERKSARVSYDIDRQMKEGARMMARHADLNADIEADMKRLGLE